MPSAVLAGDDDGVRFARVARWVGQAADPGQAADRAVRCAVILVTGTRWATVTAFAHREFTTLAGSSPAGELVDRALATGGGPLSAATRGGVPVLHVADLRFDVRGAPAVVDQATPVVGSLLSLELDPAPRGTRWALNLYADAAHAFSVDGQSVGRVLAAHVAVAMTTVHQRAHLELAVASRDLIGQAKGVLIERYRINADQAFTYLIRISQSTNRKIHDIAADVVTTGDVTAFDPPTANPDRTTTVPRSRVAPDSARFPSHPAPAR